MNWLESLKKGFAQGRDEIREEREERARRLGIKEIRPNQIARKIGKVVEQLIPRRV